MVSVDVHINPLMPGGNKNVTYLSKPAVFSCRFVWVCVTLLPPGIKGLKNQSRIQRVLYANISVWAPKLYAQINEKFSLIQMLGDKIFIVSKHSKWQLYLSVVKKLPLRYLCSLYVTFQPVFTSNFERTASVHFKYHHSFWCSLNIFRLEAVSSSNIQACLNDSLNVNMAIFLGGRLPVT